MSRIVVIGNAGAGLRAEWRTMLGENWKDVQKTWLNRLGNLTLTGYNSTYSDRPFAEKKTVAGGFSDSSVRLNRFVREQPVWTAEEISSRTEALAQRAIEAWPPLSVPRSLIDAANQEEMREQAARRDIAAATQKQTEGFAMTTKEKSFDP